MKEFVKCPVCSSSGNDKIKVFYRKEFNLYTCRGCGFIFHNVSTENPEEENVNLKFVNSDRDYFHPVKSDLFEDNIRRIMNIAPEGNKILDVGCRDGHFLSIAKKYEFECYGVEPSPIMCRYLSQKGINIVNGYYRKELFEKESFDVISFIQVLEHIPDPKTNGLEIAHYHLKKNGIIVVEVPSVNNPQIMLYKLTGINRFVKKYFIKDHCNYFSPSTMSLLMEIAGFEKVEIATGRLSRKYSGYKRLIGKVIDPFLNYLNLGGLLYIGRKK